MVSETKIKFEKHGGQASPGLLYSVDGLIVQYIKMQGLHNPPASSWGKQKPTGTLRLPAAAPAVIKCGKELGP